jgi:hypothetical protein
LAVAPDDWRAVLDRNLVQTNGGSAALEKRGTVTRGADIANPVGVVAEHRHQVALTIEVSDDDRQPHGFAGLAAYDFESGDPRRASTAREDARPHSVDRPRK